MNLYRVTHMNYASHFNGRGASFEDGARWNTPGHPVIYFGLDLGTALVEAANYIPSPRLVPASHCKAIYTVSDDVSIRKLDLSTLPDDWDSMPYGLSTQRMGDIFLEANDALLFLVPSVALGSADYAIAIANPLHPDIVKIELIQIIQPVYSERMFQGL